VGEREKLEISFHSLGDGWEVDAVCKKCGENGSECICGEDETILPPSRHNLVYKVVMRRGKPVTAVGEFHIPKSEAKRVLKVLKKTLGCGGTFKSGWIEIQGRREEEIRKILILEGFTR